MLAAETGEVAMVKLLVREKEQLATCMMEDVEYKVNLEDRDSNGETALLYAAKHHNI